MTGSGIRPMGNVRRGKKGRFVESIWHELFSANFRQDLEWGRSVGSFSGIGPFQGLNFALIFFVEELYLSKLEVNVTLTS